MAKVKIKIDDQIRDAEFTETGFDNKRRGDKGNGIFGEFIKFEVDTSNPANAYKSPSKIKGVIDLTKSTAWGINPSISKEDLISYSIKLHQPKSSSFITNLFTNITQIFQFVDQNILQENENSLFSAVVSNPYANQIIADDLNWTIKLPLLSLMNLDYSTNFGNGENEGSGFAVNIASSVANFFQNSPLAKGFFGGKDRGALTNVLVSAAGANAGGLANSLVKALYPSVNATRSSERFYRGSQSISYPMTFELLNTINEETTRFNTEFVRFMSYIVSASSRNKIIEDSPVIGEAEIEGLRYIPLVKLDFKYEGRGNFLYIDGEPIPEAYACTLEINEMLPHYRNLQHAYIHRGKKLRAINNDPKALCNSINDGIRTGANVLDKILR